MSSRRVPVVLASILSLVLTAGAAGAGPGAAGQSSNSAAAGKGAQSLERELLDEVKQHPLARLGPWLINLHEEFEQFAKAGKPPAAFRTKNPVLRVTNGMVAIEGTANDPTALRGTLAAIGAKDVRGSGNLFSARVPVAGLDRLGRDPALRSAAPVLAKTRALPVPAESQGVQSLFGLDGPDNPGIDGTGFRIGILSDSFGCEPDPFLPGAPTSSVADDVANDEIPEDVVVADDVCPNFDEGRAIGQLIHDVAPGASEAFHTAFNSRFDFACGILELGGIDTVGAANACGAFGIPYAPLTGDDVSDIVVDDVIYFAEPMFMPGAVAQGANAVFDNGTPYFSSAGNNARLSYEAAYREIVDNGNFGRNLKRGAGRGPNPILVHDFGGGDTAQTITMLPSGGSAFVVLSFQWDQPHFSSTAFGTLLNGGTLTDALDAPAATTDMDALFYNAKGILVPLCPPGVATGITCQITGTDNLASGDAVDLAALFVAGPGRPRQFHLRFTRSAGSEDVNRVKYVPFEIAGAITIDEHDTRSGTSYGHSNARGAASIGAAAWYATVEWKDNPADPIGLYRNEDGSGRCDPACAEDFSSAGNIPVFFDGLGNELPSPVVRENPWVTGPDGGNTSFFFSDSSFDDDDNDGFNNPFSTFLTPLDEDPSSEYPNFFGTSASAPHVAAVAGLMLQINPGLTPDDIYGILKNTAEDMGLRATNRLTAAGPVADVIPVDDPVGFDFDTGWGFVDAEAALDSVPAP
ncbi:MAG TPA: S8 family serine peptidase [Woeseiaceae bacterium]|nr:S8 family serine peptidase [Woeseiaceae bacterium]